jgi:hypothetical protein
MNLAPTLYINFHESNKCLLVTTDLSVQLVNLKKKKAEELFKISEILVPSFFQLLDNTLLVASRF